MRTLPIAASSSRPPVMAAEFSKDRSRVVSASQERVTRLGFLRGGPPPLGLKRIMVTRGGEPLQTEAGEWKGLASCRTKLAPGDANDVEVVRNIFRMYAEETP